jgi:hypothetical protein
MFKMNKKAEKEHQAKIKSDSSEEIEDDELETM